MKLVEVGGVSVLLANVAGEYYAIGNKCTHRGCKLSSGVFEDETVKCPCHCRSLDELRLVAERYFGDRWYLTDRQLEALKDEAKRRSYVERWAQMLQERKLPW